ncbi:DgyrCDS6796 [Dimorphilus gyrociliatus]|uniref:DgyrCDS6796 n=1 Tax=Dimorphilus gyrociliatus TaxID=2664684 RepID=A0A7I8VRD0_9ANNE|nr:DgyrCDS6796 [Dimorphilus gyrociliatus]
MAIILRLEDQVFYYILRNFGYLKDKTIFLKLFKLKNISPMMCEKIFNGLNTFYAGMPRNIFEAFTTKSIPLKNVILCDENLDHKTCRKFLKRHKFQSLKIQLLKHISVEELVELVDNNELRVLGIHNCSYIQKSELNSNLKGKKDIVEKLNLRFLKNPPQLRNLTVLNISNTSIDDIHFYCLTREVYHLEDVNIAETHITDLRLLKKQENLQYLDCTELSSDVGNSYIHLHCLTRLKRLRFGNANQAKTNLKLAWSHEIHPLIMSYLNENQIKQYKGVPDQFRSKCNWDISAFLELADWKDLLFFDLCGSWAPSPKSVCDFIQRHGELRFIKLSEDFPDILYRSIDFYRTLKDLFDIHHYERIYGRNEMSFRILFDDQTYPVDPFEVEGAGSAFDDFPTDYHETVVIPKIIEFRESFPKKSRLELCQYLTDEMMLEKFNSDYSEYPLGEKCLQILCMNIERSSHFLTLITSIAEKFLQKSSYIGGPIDYTFIDVLTKYHRYFRLVTNIKEIYERLFTEPDTHVYGYGYYCLIKSLICFLEELNIKEMPKDELRSLCKGINKTKSWKQWAECQELSERLHFLIINIISFCKKLGWNMKQLEKNIKPLTRKFEKRGSFYVQYYPGEERGLDEEIESDEECETYTDNEDWDVHK